MTCRTWYARYNANIIIIIIKLSAFVGQKHLFSPIYTFTPYYISAVVSLNEPLFSLKDKNQSPGKRGMILYLSVCLVQSRCCPVRSYFADGVHNNVLATPVFFGGPCWRQKQAHRVCLTRALIGWTLSRPERLSVSWSSRKIRVACVYLSGILDLSILISVPLRYFQFDYKTPLMCIVLLKGKRECNVVTVHLF